jgi:hypothetical protein
VIVAGLLGLILVFGSDVASDRRGIGNAIAGIVLVAILLGGTLRLELQPGAPDLAIAGAIVSLLAVLWFLLGPTRTGSSARSRSGTSSVAGRSGSR